MDETWTALIPLILNCVDSRIHALTVEFNSVSNETSLRSLIEQYAFNPVHPLLFSTVLAMAATEPREREGALIAAYRDGAIIKGLEEGYVEPDPAYPKLYTVFFLEEDFLRAWCAIGSVFEGSHRSLDTEKGVEIWREISSGEDMKNDVRYWKSIWNVWMLCNPIYWMFDGLQGGIFDYGFRWNSYFHNSAESIGHHIGKINRDINALMSQKGPRDAGSLASQRNHYKFMTKMHHRAKLLYDWNPCEADAHSTSLAVMKELYKNLPHIHDLLG